MAAFDPVHERLFKEPNLAAVTTLRRDGTPHTSPTWVDWDGEHVLVNTAYGNAKVAHVQRNPQVSVMVVDRNDPFCWVGVSGPAELDDDGAVEHLRELSWRYMNEDYAFKDGERRVIMRVTPVRVTPAVTSVLLCDVGPRDGLQNERNVLAPAVRAELVNRLAAAGLRRVEAVSFVRDDAVPAMAGAEEVVAAIEPRDGLETAGLVLNERGWERLAATPLGRVNVTLAATETFNRRNGNASLEEATARVERILALADRPATVTISVAFGCPFEGPVDPGAVVELAVRFEGAEVVLADTIGVAGPSGVRALVERTGAAGFHGHNTRNTGYANALAALEAGATVLDASVGGLGGCPFAPRATGNVATEDLANLLEGEGVATGLDLDALIRISEWLEGLLAHRLDGYLYRAGTWPA